MRTDVDHVMLATPGRAGVVIQPSAGPAVEPSLVQRHDQPRR